MSDPKIRKCKTYELRLTKFELLHLRDLFGVLLSPEAKQTVSQALASAEERSTVEARLWQRVAAACKKANLPLDENAPDFICAAIMTTAPSVSVFRISPEPNEQSSSDEASVNHPFGET